MTFTTLARRAGSEQTPAAGGVGALLAGAGAEVIAISSLAPTGATFGPSDVRSGVRYRALFPDSVRTTPAWSRHIRALAEYGVSVRTTPVVMVNALVIDGRTVVLPADGVDRGVAVLRLNSVLAATIGYFERAWSEAVPVVGADVVVAAELSWREQEVLRLMALGCTDGHIAAQVGVSVRTVRRMIAQLMSRLGARSRFQAGVKAADRGWLLDR
ncbi:helix-turn-helix transcriptional regulator [Kribbella sandramycini]|uniref:DNA-binding CsgD family transcriptional regulator n=1 Tax=Kribbella sandramycini TaxID=60450 RepID=A0A7Y4L1P6_9ACTN|nr:helix-turn-helix transcriptional regulator [Kribbella sandramycini]MBB6566625.1 DNA-binding CsgD family transcriptional regulator [Kribbella sandramycini]NOL42720.1 helix-turn-helix transcriptional regulator [Kribbella sandramycini]